MALEQIVYVGTDTDYATTLKAHVADTIAFETAATVADASEVLDAESETVAVVDTTCVDNPVEPVQSLTDSVDSAPVVAVVESATDPISVFDVLVAGAADYVERDVPDERPGQLVDRLTATVADHPPAGERHDTEQHFRDEFEARRRAEKRLTTVLDRIPQPVFYRDADGVYLGCNAAFEDFCGQPREDIVGYRTDTLQNERLAEICERHDEAVLETGETKVIETTVSLQGEQRHVRVHKAPLTDDRTGLDAVVGSIEDVTVQQRQKATLREQTENLEVLNSVTRHDIRNDLQVVLGMAEVLRDHVDDEGMEYLETIVNNGQHAVDITRQARDLTETMLESEFGTDRIPLKSTLETQIDEIRSTYDRAIVTVEGTVPNQSVVADEMLASVFRNILANGIQHNDSSVPRLRVWAETTGERVTVHIADNGPGVPNERKDEIFGRGEKGLESAGTGLGLYLVDTLIDRYGGDVYVTDGDDGAEFVISLRRAEN